MDEVLHRLERRTNRVYWSDGLLDLMSGLTLVIIGASWLGGWVVFGGVAPALIVPLWKPLRRRFTEPRLGAFELADARQVRQMKFLRLAVVAGSLSFLLGIVALLGFEYRPDLIRAVVPAAPGVMLGLAAIATAEALELRRFFAYGGVLIAAGIGVVCVGAEINPGWAMLVGGVVMIIGGVALAIRMVKSHPMERNRA